MTYSLVIHSGQESDLQLLQQLATRLGLRFSLLPESTTPDASWLEGLTLEETDASVAYPEMDDMPLISPPARPEAYAEAKAAFGAWEDEPESSQQLLAMLKEDFP